MKLSERIAYIDQTLNQMYPNPPVPLNHKDPYTLLLAVLLSAQCTDDRVNQVTPRLFELADSPQEMAKKSVSQINNIVRPCGLVFKKA
jgi:endonuclease-3